MTTGLFFYIFDLAGTFVFAVSGALAGVRKRLDIYGICILAILTSLGGGMIRDILLGRTPPLVFTDVLYLLMAFSAAFLVMIFHSHLAKFVYPLRIADAIGLGIFTVIGTKVSLELGGSWFASIMMGIVSGTGGGMLRDVLIGEVPFVLQKEIYAVASLLGGAFFVIWTEIFAPSASTISFDVLPMSIGAVLASALTAVLRIIAVYKNWHLPKVSDK